MQFERKLRPNKIETEDVFFVGCASSRKSPDAASSFHSPDHWQWRAHTI